MASRPPRTPRSDSASRSRGSQARPDDKTGDRDASQVIDDSSLERREIPSYSDTREARIAERAYWRAEQRGFMPGRELEDWLEAEREIDSSKERSSER